MMRQAGRYMKVYQDLCKKHTSFRRAGLVSGTSSVVEANGAPMRALLTHMDVPCLVYCGAPTSLFRVRVPRAFS